MKLPALIFVAAIAALLAGSSPARAVTLNCPQVINVKAIGTPLPWSAAPHRDAILHFAEASYSCSNGICTLSCAYAASGSV